MNKFIAIGLPEEFTKKFTDFCHLWEHETAEPYISLIEPSLLENIKGLEQKLQSFCLAQTEFNVTIGGPGTLKDTLLYLSVLPGNITMVRKKLMTYLKIDNEDKLYRPYIAIMLRDGKSTKINIPKVSEVAKQVFNEPYVFGVDSFDIYTQQKDTGLFKSTKTVLFLGR